MHDPHDIDVVIIGAGAAGLTAALSAHADGAKVAVVEKGDRLGGSAAISGGIVWIAQNPLMAAAGIDDNAQDATEYFTSLNHGDIDPDVLAAFVREGPMALAFLHDADALRLSIMHGYPDYYLDRPGAKPGGGRALDNDLFDFNLLGDWRDKVFNGGDIPRMMLRETPLGGGSGMIDPAEMQRRSEQDLRGWGQALIGRLLHACLARGVVPQLGCRGQRLLTQNGRVTGVQFEQTGERKTLHAQRGVVLATGGFEWNAELKQSFLRGPLDAPASPPGNTGDGLKMAMAAGAGLGNMTSAWWVPTLSIPGANWPDGARRSLPVLIERTLPHTVMVNRAGRRFCNEANNYSALAGAFHFFDPAHYAYTNLPAYLIFDDQYRQLYPLAGAMIAAYVPDWVTRADTLEALAEKLHINGDGLVSTISQFNEAAVGAADPVFGRGNSAYDRFYGDRSRPGAAATLGALDHPPYYAVEIQMGALGTNGGAHTNTSAQILDVDGAPIPGLFGAGNVIACPTGGVYAGAGGTLGPALTFGFIAGRAAARRSNF